jgi:hypothetical protein
LLFHLLVPVAERQFAAVSKDRGVVDLRNVSGIGAGVDAIIVTCYGKMIISNRAKL